MPLLPLVLIFQFTSQSGETNVNFRSHPNSFSKDCLHHAGSPFRPSILFWHGLFNAAHRLRRLCSNLLSRRSFQRAPSQPDHSSTWRCLLLLDTPSNHPDFSGGRWPRTNPSPTRRRRISPCLSDGGSRRLGGHEFTGPQRWAGRTRSSFLLHHSSHRYADFRHSHLLRVSFPCQSCRPQAPHPRCNRRSHDRRHRPMAIPWPKKPDPGRALVLPLSRPAGQLTSLWSTHKLHRATIWASAFLIFIQQIRIPIGHTATWHSFAAWVQSVAR